MFLEVLFCILYSYPVVYFISYIRNRIFTDSRHPKIFIAYSRKWNHGISFLKSFNLKKYQQLLHYEFRSISRQLCICKFVLECVCTCVWFCVSTSLELHYPTNLQMFTYANKNPFPSEDKTSRERKDDTNMFCILVWVYLLAFVCTFMKVKTCMHLFMSTYVFEYVHFIIFACWCVFMQVCVIHYFNMCMHLILLRMHKPIDSSSVTFALPILLVSPFDEDHCSSSAAGLFPFHKDVFI